MPVSAQRTFTVRHVQLARALFAAVAALMVTFSPDHSAVVGLAVFSGFALATGLVDALGAWLAAEAGFRWPFVLMAIVSFLAGMAGGVPAWRSTPLFFVLVIVWGAATGLVELLAGIRARRSVAGVHDGSRDAVLVGALGLLMAVALLIVPMQYAWTYSIEKAGQFTLTGITLAVGIFGAYAAVVAVFLGIAGFSPRPLVITEAPAPRSADSVSSADQGGIA